MAHGCSSELMTATPPDFAPLHRLAEQMPCLKRKHILLAFVRQSDVKTSEPSLPQKLVLHQLGSGLASGLGPKNRPRGGLHANP
jgi:hypothetical protein